MSLRREVCWLSWFVMWASGWLLLLGFVSCATGGGSCDEGYRWIECSCDYGWCARNDQRLTLDPCKLKCDPDLE